jgi:hypothetical protein
MRWQWGQTFSSDSQLQQSQIFASHRQTSNNGTIS